MTPAFKKHFAAVEGGTITKTNIIGIRKAINATEKGWDCPSASVNEIFRLEELIEAKRPRVTGELHESGIALLRSPRYAKRLEHVAGVIADFDHFELVEFDRIGPRGQYAVPVYAVVDTAGRTGFRFRNIPWQSGGDGPEVFKGN